MTGRRRTSFRVRLAALIAGVFVSGGAALIGVQYLLVERLMEHQIDTATVVTTLEPSGPQEPTGTGGSVVHLCADDMVPIEIIDATSGAEPTLACISPDGELLTSMLIGGSLAPQERAQAVEQLIQQTTTRTTTRMSAEVLHSLLVWSLAVLGGFAVLAVVAAWWLSRRSLGRIADITAATRAITHDDLHRRLSLPGPADEVKELGDTIDGMLDRIEDAFTRQDRFISGASHELRTPLATTRTLLEIPLEQGRVPADLEPDIREALAANRRSEQLIAGLLALARARHGAAAGAPPEQAVPRTDLTSLARRLLAERAPAIAERSLRVTPPDAGPVLATVDPDVALLAVSNLVDNAIRHGAENGDLTVRTGTSTADDGEAIAWVDVANDGDDLTGCDVDALREPFHRGAGSRLAGQGLGLGLALVDSAARSAHGELTLSARHAGGLSARLRLPAGAEPDA